MRVIRSFLALKLGLATAESLTEVQQRLKDECKKTDAVIRWVPPPNIHVTMRFLGQITEPMSHAVEDMLDPIIAGTESFDMEITGIGAFPNIERPRIVWAGIGQGRSTLVSLYEKVFTRLVTAGFNFEDKPFSPHITLGRVKHAASGTIAPILREVESTAFGVSTIRHFYCYQSDLTPQGAEYTAQWVIPFKRRPVLRQERSTSGQVSPPPPSTGEDDTAKSDTTETPQTEESNA